MGTAMSAVRRRVQVRCMLAPCAELFLYRPVARSGCAMAKKGGAAGAAPRLGRKAYGRLPNVRVAANARAARVMNGRRRRDSGSLRWNARLDASGGLRHVVTAGERRRDDRCP